MQTVSAVCGVVRHTCICSITALQDKAYLLLVIDDAIALQVVTVVAIF